MKFKFDHDLHIHSCLSLCSEDPTHTNERILQYAEERGLHTVCLTNHFWDERVAGGGCYGYEIQNYAWITQALPLPQSDKVHFLFGCETEMNKDFTIGLSKDRLDAFDFIIVPTTHLHFPDFTLARSDDTVKGRAKAWVDRFDALLNADLPFHKVGFPHLASIGMTRFMGDTSVRGAERLLEVLNSISDTDMNRLFKRAAELGVGIELNAFCVKEIYAQTPADAEVILRPYRIAKENGCKFYCGSDSHKVVEHFPADHYDRFIDMLGLEDKDEYDVKKLWKKRSV